MLELRLLTIRSKLWIERFSRFKIAPSPGLAKSDCRETDALSLTLLKGESTRAAPLLPSTCRVARSVKYGGADKST